MHISLRDFWRWRRGVSPGAWLAAFVLALACGSTQAETLPDVEVAQLGGEPASVGSALAGKPMLVWFWAPW